MLRHVTVLLFRSLPKMSKLLRLAIKYHIARGGKCIIKNKILTHFTMEAWQLNWKQAALKSFLHSQKDNIHCRANTYCSMVAGDRKHACGLICCQSFFCFILTNSCKVFTLKISHKGKILYWYKLAPHVLVVFRLFPPVKNLARVA